MKRNIKWILLLVPLLLLVVGLTSAVVFPHYWFIAGEYVGVRCGKVQMTPVQVPELTEMRWEALTEAEHIRMEQSMMLINTESPIGDGFLPDLAEYRDTGVMMNACMTEAYGALAAAVAEEYGEKLYISDSYRTAAEQTAIQQTAGDTAADPGSSEHEAGLALDVYVPYYAGFGFIKAEAGRFVNAKCWEYGFIIRYPSFGQSHTGIPYEPWHIRYVGQPHAKLIYSNHLTLEEYVRSLAVGQWYEADGYLISRQQQTGEGALLLPASFASASVSPDNTGCYIVTVKK